MAIDGKKTNGNKKSSKHVGVKRKISSSAFDDKKELTSCQRRRLAKEERQSSRKHADVVKEAKTIWNSLRCHNNNDATKKKTEQVKVLLDLLQTQLGEVALQHDGSRIVQCMIQFATPAQLEVICRQLCAPSNLDSSLEQSNSDKKKIKNALMPSVLVQLAKDQYAHFCPLKLIKYTDGHDACTQLVIKAFKGHISKLALHAVGARVVDFLFRTYPAQQTKVLKYEFYGPHVSLFTNNIDTAAGTMPTLKSVLARFQSDNDEKNQSSNDLMVKHDSIVNFFIRFLQRGIEKEFLSYAYLHILFDEYMDWANTCLDYRHHHCEGKTDEEKKSDKTKEKWRFSLSDYKTFSSMISSLASDGGGNSDNVAPLHFVSTKQGTRVVVQCIRHGTAKDRKRIAKAFKGYTRSTLLHSDGYLALLTLLSYMDDTVTLNKSILREIMGSDKDDGAKNATQDNEEKEESCCLLELALNKSAWKLLWLLLAPTTQIKNRYLDPYEQTFISTPCFTWQGVATSKKQDNVRRLELYTCLEKPLWDMILSTKIIKRENDDKEAESETGLHLMLTSITAQHLVVQLYNNAVVAAMDKEKQKQEGSKLQQLVDRLMEEFSKNEYALVHHGVAHYALKQLFAVDKKTTTTDDEKVVLLSTKFIQNVDLSALALMSNRAAFCMVALCQTCRQQVVSHVPIESIQKRLEEQPKHGTSESGKKNKKNDEKGKDPTAGWKALLKELQKES